MSLKHDKYLKYKIQEYIEQTGVRQWLNQNKRLAAAVLVSCIIFFFIVMLVRSAPDKILAPTIERKAWFYDLNTGKLFIASDLQLPPIEAPSGRTADNKPAGVRAYLYRRGTGGNASKVFIGFLETYLPSINTDPQGNQYTDMQRFIKRPDDEQWIPAESPIGQYIMDELFTPDEFGRRVFYCKPQQ